MAGVDYLFGKAEAEGDTFEYGVNPDGSGAPSSIPLGEDRAINDTRNFAGLYANFEWTPAAAWRLEAGARLNHTRGRAGRRRRGRRRRRARRRRQARRHAACPEGSA